MKYVAPPTETLVETRKCRHCSAEFPITDKDLEFLQRLAPTVGKMKFELPLPTVCPECRKIRQLAWRNEKKIFRRNCDATGKTIISMFPPDTPFRVYGEDFWNSDKWDARDYGREFDFKRPFFEQFGELLSEIPRAATATTDGTNSEYCNNCGWLKDSYLCFNAQNVNDSCYCIDTWYCDDCMDCYCAYKSRACYDCVLIFDSQNVRHSYDVKNCRDSEFLLSCEGCGDCYGCFDLSNKQYHIFNVPYSPETYADELAKIRKLSFSEQKERFETFYVWKYDKRPLPNIGSENVVSSSNVVSSKNVSFSRNLQNVEDLRYAGIIHEAKLAMDYYTWGFHSEKIYSSHQVGDYAHSVYFSISCWKDIRNLYYSYLCVNGTHDCFWCAGIRGGSYCILNKQYTKEEYESLVPKIIEHMKRTLEWGEFPPASLSSFGYDHTVCQQMDPLAKEEAEKRGFNWSGYESPFPKVEKTIPAAKLPERIEDVPDDILNWAIECEVTKKPFRIISQELDFYRKRNIPIPRRHPDQRHLDRIRWHLNY